MTTKNEMIDLLNGDLSNELKHMLFYLYHSSSIRGMDRAELREFLTEEAASEMKHVQQFQDLIIGLGGAPVMKPNSFDTFDHPHHILQYALAMEDEVVANYALRIQQAATMTDSAADARWIEVFLEEQIMHSRTDADNLRQMVAASSLANGKMTF